MVNSVDKFLIVVVFFLFGSNCDENIKKNRLLEKDFLQFKFKSNSDPTSTLLITASPSSPIEPVNSNWTVTWSAAPTYVSSKSWIGSYFYGQQVTSENFVSKLNINEKQNGEDKLQIPKEAGIYDIRYIQDDNLQTLASVGPFIITPSDIVVNLNNSDLNLGENISVTYYIKRNTTEILSFLNSEVYLCLNIIGSYDECLWKKKIENEKGIELINSPEFAGYFVLRIIIIHKIWKQKFQTECLAVSSVFRISNLKYSFIIDQLETVRASAIKAIWKAENTELNDWVGLYSLENNDIFTFSAKALRSIKINSKATGEFYTSLPPNSQSGPYIFIYFNKHNPVAVSDIINAQQPNVSCLSDKQTMSKIKHLVIICTENHSFDSYFGTYCLSPTNSNPTCNNGPQCCEKAPDTVDGYSPKILDDEQNMSYDPNHYYSCELCEVNDGKMDRFVTGCDCSSPLNFVVPDMLTLLPLHKYANQFSLADRYFQPAVGASAQNDMYFARASIVFKDNTKIPVGSKGSNCYYLYHRLSNEYSLYYDPTITSLLSKCGFTLKTYAEGYKIANSSFDNNPCYPDGYLSNDIPFTYYGGVSDNPNYITDYADLTEDIINKTLADVSFIKPLGKNTAHPFYGTISDEVNFIKMTVDNILNSTYAEDTLILWVPDESGGFYDHVQTPKTSTVDNLPYGPRIPLLAMGKFAKKNYISHVQMKHSSIVKFIEWNWLAGKTGQLNTRDTHVNNIGDLIDAEEAGIKIPSN